MPEIGLDGARVVTIVGELVATGMPEHGACVSMPRSAATADRSIMREKRAGREMRDSAAISGKARNRHSCLSRNAVRRYRPRYAALAPQRFKKIFRD